MGKGGRMSFRPPARVSSVKPAAPVKAKPAAPGQDKSPSLVQNIPPPSQLTQQPAQPAGSGLMGQMAATAGGVAIGNVVGNALMGHGSGSLQPAYAGEPAKAPTYEQDNNPCFLQMKEFLACAQTQSDFMLCQGFNQTWKDCRMDYGVPLP